MIHDPIFIIGCPRSGTTLLFNLLSQVPALWSLGRESKEIIEKYHSPAQRSWESGVLTAADVDERTKAYITQSFYHQSAPGTFWQKIAKGRSRLQRNSWWQSLKRQSRTEKSGAATSAAVPQQGMAALKMLARWRNQLSRPPSIRLLEKTPENCLRLPFLQEIFPDARIIYLIRDGRNNINSLIEGWQQPYLFPGYQVPEPLHIPNYHRPRWAFTLIPGWQGLTNSSLAEICARQWLTCNEFVLQHRQECEGQVPYLTLRYESMIADPAAALRQLADFVGVAYEPILSQYAAELPQINVISKPDPEKWRGVNEAAIREILPLITPMMSRLGYERSS